VRHHHAAAALAALALLGGCGEPRDVPASPPRTTTVRLAAELPPLIAHRGGQARFPESSMAGYAASAASGFPLEADLRRLADGTVVVMHDATVDRTTNGAGAVMSMDVADWRRLRIDHGGGVPPTWAELLDRFGGRHLLVAEVKEPAALRPFITSVTDRRLEGSIVAQTGNLDTARATAAAGIPTMYLSDVVTDFAEVRAAGIRFLGCSRGMPDRAAYIRRARAAGLDVAVFTVNDAKTAAAVRAEGAASVFTDNPWLLDKVS
jgi:glycerophosphoryl diester phosphodiesterase